MLLSEAVRYERSKNALFDKLAEYPYMLHKESLRKLMKGELVLSQEGAVDGYMRAMADYIRELRARAMSVADTDSARRIDVAYMEACSLYIVGESYAK